MNKQQIFSREIVYKYSLDKDPAPFIFEAKQISNGYIIDIVISVHAGFIASHQFEITNLSNINYDVIVAEFFRKKHQFELNFATSYIREKELLKNNFKHDEFLLKYKLDKLEIDYFGKEETIQTLNSRIRSLERYLNKFIEDIIYFQDLPNKNLLTRLFYKWESKNYMRYI